jgi:SNF2 family DNA or RNA helicase
MSAAALLPPRLGIDYLPHQEEGVRWMLGREAEGAPLCRGGVLADDMGLGKTFQTIGLLRNSPFAATWRTLIVCPPALVAGWTEELRACGFFVSVLNQGTDTWMTVPAGVGVADTVWLTTYPRLVSVGTCLVEHAGEVRAAGHLFHRLVLDEGHCIRNGTGTARGKAADVVAGAGSVAARWILSATPVQNGPADWRNLCRWLRVRTTPEADKPVTDEDPGAAPEEGVDRLEDAAAVVMLRRTMAELRGTIDTLPPAPKFICRDLSIVRGSEEDRLFRSLCDQLEDVIDDREVSALDKLALYLRIQQFLVHPQIYIQAMRDRMRGAYPRPDWKGSATKWTAFAKDLAAGVAAKEGTIVFCQFRAEMDKVVRLAERMGAAVWSVRGGMGNEAVGVAVREAREAATAGGKGVVVVVQIVAGGAGLNLQFCRRVLFLSQHWNPAVVHQAVGRAVRIGQRGVVDVVMYRCADDVMDNLDRLMVERHLAKIEVARDICSSLYEGWDPVPLPAREEATVPTDDAVEEEEDPTM